MSTDEEKSVVGGQSCETSLERFESQLRQFRETITIPAQHPVTPKIIFTGKTTVAKTLGGKTPVEIFAILVSGKLGAGKTTTVDLLVPELQQYLESPDVHVMEAHFAAVLKDDCARISGENIRTFYTQEGKQKYLPKVGKTAGQLLQDYGEQKRQEDPDYWVKKLREHVEATAQRVGKNKIIVVIGDCRHPNEIDIMRPGFAIRLEGDPGKTRANSNRDLNHPSETGLDNYEHFDMRIDTDELEPETVLMQILYDLHKFDVRFGKLSDSVYLA